MRPSHQTIAFASVLSVLALGGVARAADPSEFTAEAPPELESVRVDEKLGAKVPLDLAFRDQDGKSIKLGDLFTGDMPIILTFNYSDCPMLCSVMLDGVVDVLPQITPFAAGEQFRIITVIIEPKEQPSRAAETRDRYLDKLQRKQDDLRKAAQEGGWTFLVAPTDGDDRSIVALADAVGFRYHKVAQSADPSRDPNVAEWAHPAVLVFLSPSGAVTRYVHGARFEANDISSSIARAGISEPSGAAGFVQRCFHYDPGAHSYARTGLNVMKFTAAVFASMVAGALVLAHLLRRNSRKGVARS
jgi:protein SCO1/2